MLALTDGQTRRTLTATAADLDVTREAAQQARDEAAELKRSSQL